MVTKKISANVDEHALLELTDEQLAQVTGGDVTVVIQVTGLPPGVQLPGTGTGIGGTGTGLVSGVIGTVTGLLGTSLP